MYKLYNKDCMGVLPMIDDKSIDLILCDLPYGTTKNEWDKVIPYDKLWEQYERIITDRGCIALFAQAPFDCLEAAREVLNWDNINGYAYINKVVADTVVYQIFCDKRKGTVRKSHVINTFNNSDMVAIATLFEAAYKRDRDGVK